MSTLIPFPQRLGAKPTSEQFEELKRMTSGEVLAAWVTKYPGASFSADELLAAKGKKIHVQAIGANEWTIRHDHR